MQIVLFFSKFHSVACVADFFHLTYKINYFFSMFHDRYAVSKNILTKCCKNRTHPKRVLPAKMDFIKIQKLSDPNWLFYCDGKNCLNGNRFQIFSKLFLI